MSSVAAGPFSSLVLRTGRRFGKESLGVEILSKLWGKNGDETISSPSAISYLPVFAIVGPNLKKLRKRIDFAPFFSKLEKNIFN